MRVRRQEPAQSRKGVSDAAPLRRARADACTCGWAGVSGFAAVLIRGSSHHRLQVPPRRGGVKRADALGPVGGKALEVSAAAASAPSGGPRSGMPTRPFGAGRRYPLRARRVGAVGEGRNAARGDRGGGGRERTGTRIRTDRLRKVLGGAVGTPSIGGVLATNLPARAALRPVPRATISSASYAVSGRGETFKSGGRVVKNVTGYDCASSSPAPGARSRS